ncbi:MAG: orotidine-5'-phosphate decarboxylase [Actinomycetota bacterium]|jgi:orotidine-5'-phosphate decarboxylase
MAETFGQRLQERIKVLGPLCVGIDPSRHLLASWERDDDAAGAEFVSLALLESALGNAAAIKPQVAYYERFGSAGFRILERVIADAHDAGILIIADAKRGDIGSTNDGYADAWLTKGSPLAVDALTVSPYLGIAAMGSLIARASESGRGLFVVVASSNDEGRPVQTAKLHTDEKVEDFLLRQLAEINHQGGDLGSLGAVVGATRDRPHFDLASLHGPYLVPGVGAQGASPDDVGKLFERCPQGTVLVNVSRAIAASGPDVRSLRDTIRRWRDDLSAALA